MLPHAEESLVASGNMSLGCMGALLLCDLGESQQFSFPIAVWQDPGVNRNTGGAKDRAAEAL